LVDEYVDVDMSVRLDAIRTEECGVPMVTTPTYAIWARPRTSFLDPHGHIVKQKDIDWLERTASDDQNIYRVNQLHVKDSETGKDGFLVEVLSGIDARHLRRVEMMEDSLLWAKTHWWQVGLALAAAWWWFS